MRDPGLALVNPRTWILQGEKLDNGACRYNYTDAPTTIPKNGWARLSIAIDPSTRRKLMEEGAASDPAALRAAAGISAGDSVGSASVLSRRGAWQAVNFYDIANIQLTTDVTQIYWDYNGSTVSNGSTSGVCANAPWWSLDYCYKSDSYPTGSYLGNTWSKFRTSFCVGLPTTYIYYYYNKLWGHPDGTAARAQSSDSVDECILLHNAVYAGYN